MLLKFRFVNWMIFELTTVNELLAIQFIFKAKRKNRISRLIKLPSKISDILVRSK